jgi:hypothetical protein
LGLTVTTPSINLFGDGSMGITLAENSVVSPERNVLVSDYQDKLDTYFSSPLSISFGIVYPLGKATCYFSSEYFFQSSAFYIMNPKKFLVSNVERDLVYKTKFGLEPVFNYGFGIKYLLSKTTQLTAGITTDFSANNSELQSQFYSTTWDIYHFTLGSNFQIDLFAITFGLRYSFGSDYNVNFYPDARREQIFNEMHYNNIKAIFGLRYGY